MPVQLQVTIDCADPGRLAPFWAAALDYVVQPPPEGFDSWPAALAAWGVPESEWDSASAVVDPTGAGPRIFLQRVPEPKAVKNRVHLDLRISGGPDLSAERRAEQIQPVVDRLVALGATGPVPVQGMGGYWVVLRDPEGNEFCLT